MSSKKDKLIEEAQRFALRGQLDKAVKAYQQVVALDPSAINQRQKLADLLVKAGRSDEARTELEAIGKAYSNNGFYLKAIAVFKKLQTMFPGDIGITLTLAGLNEKHGLVANALAEYKQVYEYYERASNTEEALKILDRMQDVDKQNVGIKLKLAEAYFQAGKKDLSYTVFSRLASLLQERGDQAAVNKLNIRIQQLFPEKSNFMLEVLAEQIGSGNAASAVNGLQSLLRSNPHDKRVWELVVQAYRKLNQLQRLKAACRHFIKFFPDEPQAHKALVDCLVADKDVSGALSHLELHEVKLFQGVPAGELVALYDLLRQQDPLNIRILRGLRRAYEASGDNGNAAAIAQKMDSLGALPLGQDEQSLEAPELEQGVVEGRQFEDPVPGMAASDFGASFADSSPFLDLPGAVVEEAVQDEIEIEIDIDEQFAVPADDAPAASAEESWLDAVEEVFESIAATPRSVKFGSDLDSSDAQSHFDLGLAFKEMGLYDEAINEFRHAAEDSGRKVDCLVLQGACLREKGDVVKAESVLRSLLKPGLTPEKSCLVKYELALTCEMMAKHDEAAAFLAEIDAVNPDFRDVRSRLNAVEGDASLDFSDEELQGFDLK